MTMTDNSYERHLLLYVSDPRAFPLLGKHLIILSLMAVHFISGFGIYMYIVIDPVTVLSAY